MSEQNIVQLMALYNDRSQGSMAKLEGDSADSDTQLTKLDVVLTFQLEVSHNKIPQNIWRSYNHYNSPKLLNVLHTFLLMKVLQLTY